MALVLALRNAGDPLPAAIFAAAPFSDLTLSGPSVRAFNGEDPAANRDLLTFMGASYFQSHEPTDPLVSPLFSDLAGLPPLFVTASQGEVLLSDTTRLAERAEKASVDVTLRVVEDSVYVYPIFPFLPETKATMEEVAAWARRNLRRNPGGRVVRVPPTKVNARQRCASREVAMKTRSVRGICWRQLRVAMQSRPRATSRLDC